MASQGLKRVARLGVVIREEEVADLVIQCIVEAAFALEGVSLAECTRFQQELHNFKVSTKTSLHEELVASSRVRSRRNSPRSMVYSRSGLSR